MDDFAERLRRHDGTADELDWPAELPRHQLACDVRERALRLHGQAQECLDAVIEVRRSLKDPPALKAIAAAWDEAVRHPDAPWQAAIRLPQTRGILPHPADGLRAHAFGEPVEDWQKLLEFRAWDAERVWQNYWLASKL